MKRFAIAVLAIFGMFSSAEARTEYEGAVCITSVTTACVDEGWVVGPCLASRYSPRGVVGNGTQTRLSVFARTFAVGFGVDANPVSSRAIKVNAAKVASGGYMFEMGFRLTSQSPLSPNSSTNEITLSGVFTAWDEIPGCTIGFRGAYTRSN
jgi:hypothetical protein